MWEVESTGTQWWGKTICNKNNVMDGLNLQFVTAQSQYGANSCLRAGRLKTHKGISLLQYWCQKWDDTSYIGTEWGWHSLQNIWKSGLSYTVMFYSYDLPLHAAHILNLSKTKSYQVISLRHIQIPTRFLLTLSILRYISDGNPALTMTNDWTGLCWLQY
jgi:hypothetical protein